MQLARLALLVGLVSGFAPAALAGVNDQEASYFFRNFTDADDVHVSSHFLGYLLGLDRGWELSFQFNHETVTVPAIQAPTGTQEAVDAITSASRPISGGGDAYREFSKDRNELQGDIGTQRVKLGYYVSHEDDYFAQLVRARVNRDLFRANLNLAAGASYGWDSIKPLDDEDTPGTADGRRTWHTNVVATQVLSPTTVLRLGGEVNWVEGLQHSPYRNVYAGGGPVPERHPNRRVRTAAFLRLSQYLRNRSSIKGNYIYYRDDWGVGAHTVGLWLHQYVSEDVVVRYRYRYHKQDAANFYRAEYESQGGIGGFLSGDYRLEEFNSHLFGAQLMLGLRALQPRNRLLRRMQFRFKYERYFNTNNFSANVLESGLAYRF